MLRAGFIYFVLAAAAVTLIATKPSIEAPDALASLDQEAFEDVEQTMFVPAPAAHTSASRALTASFRPLQKPERGFGINAESDAASLEVLAIIDGAYQTAKPAPVIETAEDDLGPQAGLLDLTDIEFVSFQNTVRVYEVELGDSLTSISEAFYNSPFEYPRILEANRESDIETNGLVIGQELVLPE